MVIFEGIGTREYVAEFNESEEEDGDDIEDFNPTIYRSSESEDRVESMDEHDEELTQSDDETDGDDRQLNEKVILFTRISGIIFSFLKKRVLLLITSICTATHLQQKKIMKSKKRRKSVGKRSRGPVLEIEYEMDEPKQSKSKQTH